MNRPSNIPPPNMSRHHMHGHHNMRAAPPPPPLQSVAPPPHALPLGFPPPPALTNVQQQQRPNRTQNYHHTFMDSSANSGAGAPFVHYNRMGVGNPSSKKYHPLNKPRTSKPPDNSHHQHHQVQVLQHHHQHHSYPSSQFKPDIPPNCTTGTTTSSSGAAAASLQMQNEMRRPPPSMHQTQATDCYPSSSKKYPDIPQSYELNFQQTPAITPVIAAAASTEAKRADDQVFAANSMKTSHATEEIVDDAKHGEGLKDDGHKKVDNDDDNNIKMAEAAEEKGDEEDINLDTKEDDDEDGEPTTATDANSDNADFKSSREKTPMCLVNDLARFNKISFQYRLTGENGPAHCKRFTVTLKLGDEEYIAEGLKIKEAQHLAAKEAIRKTKYKHPIPKTNRRNEEQGGASRVNVTPTVELNALAMKLGLQTYYIFDPRQASSTPQDNNKGCTTEKVLQPRYRVNPGLAAGGPNQLHGSAGNFGGGGGTFVPNLTHNPAIMHVQQAAGHHHHHPHHRGNFQHCYPVLPPHMVAATHHLNSTLFPTPCRITLIVGTQKFVGNGRTIQLAKHDAAAQAIEALKEQMDNQQKEITDEKSNDSDNKSPISLVFEIGIKRNLPVDFKILREDGPAHMRTFTTACIVGQIVTEAEGTGKKISKKKAAQKMLEELNKLPPVVTPTNSPTKRVKTKTTAPRKSAVASSTHVKPMHVSDGGKETATQRGGAGGAEDKPKKRSSDSESDPSNPITKLIELFQHNKEKEPVFKLITESGKERTRQRQFVVEVSSNDTTARGVGNSKKSARRNAAQNFLMSLGLDIKDKPLATEQTEDQLTEMTNIEKPITKPEESARISDTNVVIVDKELSTEEPEVVVVSCVKEVAAKPAEEKPMQSTANIASSLPASSSAISTNTNTTTTATTTATTTTKATGFHMKDKLLYLARLMGFEVDFSDYPKGNHNEFLSIVMISTNPPQICHGIGANAMESQEDAASNALKILSEMGLNK